MKNAIAALAVSASLAGGADSGLETATPQLETQAAIQETRISLSGILDTIGSYLIPSAEAQDFNKFRQAMAEKKQAAEHEIAVAKAETAAMNVLGEKGKIIGDALKNVDQVKANSRLLGEVRSAIVYLENDRNPVPQELRAKSLELAAKARMIFGYWQVAELPN